MNSDILGKIIEQVGNQRLLAELIGVGQQTVSHWLTHDYPVPAEKAVLLEKKTKGEIPRWFTRPDLWDKPSNMKSLARR